MIFTDIRVQQYRSYDDASFDLGEGVNIIVGPNAAGKTNLLEALMMSAGSSSYRAKDEALIMYGKNWARIDAHTNTNQTRTIKLQTTTNEKTQKTYQIDDKIYKRLPLSQKHPVVLFEPNDLFLLLAEPNKRREYIDRVVAKYEVGYEGLLAKYRRILAQRNALLKKGQSAKEQIFVWDLKLCEAASQIIAKRVSFIATLNQEIAHTYNKIAGQKRDIRLEHHTNTPTKNYETALLKQLQKTQEIDFARGFTGSGPHRDDLLVYFGEKLAVHQASRGEVRTVLLALKVIELELLEKYTSKRPLLLLDDVFSELDGARRRALTEHLSRYQTLITTTDADVVVKSFTQKTKIIPLQ